MVIKYQDEPTEVYFIEAIGTYGIVFKRFSGMTEELGKFYKKVVLRHLNWKRTDVSLRMLEKFVDEVHGANY